MNGGRAAPWLCPLLLGACVAQSAGSGQSDTVGGRAELPAPTEQLFAATPKTSYTVGCEPSAVGVLHDDGAVPYDQRFTRPHHRPFTSGSVVRESLVGVDLNGVAPLEPRDPPPSKPLRLVTVDSFGATSLVYAPDVLAQDATYLDLIELGAIVVTQRAFAGQDAAFVLREVDRNRWPVIVATHDAALVWGDPSSKNTRAFGLYWGDGPREWMIRGAIEPDILVDLARSIYC